MEGFGQRLKDQIKKAGFVNSRGGAAIAPFAMKHGFLPNYVYRWANDDVIPNRENLLKLAEVLDCDAGWLLLGDYKRLRGALSILLPFLLGLSLIVATSGTAEAQALPNSAFIHDSGHNMTKLRLLGTWLRRLWRSLGQTNPMHNAWSAEASYCAS